MYAIILIALLTGFTYLNAIGAAIAGFAWILICGTLSFVIAKLNAERWEKFDGRS